MLNICVGCDRRTSSLLVGLWVSLADEHLFLFCSKETDATRIKKTLTVWARVLFPLDKYPNPWPVDIFPIQEKLKKNEDGSLYNPGWINLPYFDAKNKEGKRYCVEGLKKISLSEFLQAAESRTVELEAVLIYKVRSCEIPSSEMRVS